MGALHARGPYPSCLDFQLSFVTRRLSYRPNERICSMIIMLMCVFLDEGVQRQGGPAVKLCATVESRMFSSPKSNAV